jgi:phytoene dehydrogenase-like protein
MADVAIVGGGHNALVAATLLARAGRSVVVLERSDHVGGAAISRRPFAGVDARLSRYSYLVGLFPGALRAKLGIGVELRERPISSYTPLGDTGLLVDEGDHVVTRASFTRALGDGSEFEAWQRLRRLLQTVAARVAPTLCEPLVSRTDMRRVVGDGDAFGALCGEPLSHLLERSLASDPCRGVMLTDATIGTFSRAGEPALRQNRCFLYHVIGDGTGLWKVPVGGMGALTDELARAAAAAGAELRVGAEVTAISTDGVRAEVRCDRGETVSAHHVLANVAPAILAALLGEPAAVQAPEGSQLKLNMLLRRLPAILDRSVTSERAFAGTFHVNEGYEQLQRAYEEAAAGRIPALPPCELYCHSLTDPTILSDELRAAGAQTLTLFGLHMPARLFRADPAGAKRAAVAATLHSVNAVLAEPIEDCLWTDREGAPCVEAVTPIELEAELGMPGGHIFHRDMAWPFAEADTEVGRWGVETGYSNVWLCGAGARRGGGVSGIPGHNAAMAVLAAG